jgi:FkbH-like protein
LAQLTQKTNQFNITTKRYNEAEIEQFINNIYTHVYGLEYEDKFGNEGTIGEAIIKYEEKNIHIDTFLLSCRVLGRKVEYAFLYKILKEAKNEKMLRVYAEYLPTEKNIISKDFYKNCGFDNINNNKFEADIDALMKKLLDTNLKEWEFNNE